MAASDSRFRGAEQVAHECGRLIGRQGSEADDGEPIHLSCGREDDQERRRLRRGDDVGEEPREPGTRTVHVIDLDQRRPFADGDLDQSPQRPSEPVGFDGPVEGEDRTQVWHDSVRVGLPREDVGQPCRDRVGRAEGLDARQRFHELGQRPSRSAEVGGCAGDREVPQIADRAGELVDESTSSDAGFADDEEAGRVATVDRALEPGAEVGQRQVSAHKGRVPASGRLHHGRRSGSRGEVRDDGGC